MKKNFKVVGLRVEKYLKTTCNGHNCNYDYSEEIDDKHTLLLLDSDNEKYEVSFTEEEGECYSGWTTASWACIELNKVDNFRGYTHKPKKELNIELDMEDYNYDNEVFNFSHDGGDRYYPCGYYTVNMDLFITTSRYKDKMPIWIFIGESGVGKSYIANHIEGLCVFETDSYDCLPDKIISNIIVLGNKHKYTLEDIVDKIPYECEVHIVKFE